MSLGLAQHVGERGGGRQDLHQDGLEGPGLCRWSGSASSSTRKISRGWRRVRSSRDMEQWRVGRSRPEQGGGGGTGQVQGNPGLFTCTDKTVCTSSSIEGRDCKEVHGVGVVLPSKHITHITDNTANANPKTTGTTNPYL